MLFNEMLIPETFRLFRNTPSLALALSNIHQHSPHFVLHLVELVHRKGLLGQGIHMLRILFGEFGFQTSWAVPKSQMMNRVGYVGEGRIDLPLVAFAYLKVQGPRHTRHIHRASRPRGTLEIGRIFVGYESYVELGIVFVSWVSNMFRFVTL